MVWTVGAQLYSGRYVIEKLLGQGRFGITYLARDKNNEPVVIKTLSDRFLNSSDAERLQQLFVQGAVKLAKCQHPHIVKVKTTFQEGGVWCIAMEYIDGIDLASRAQMILPEAEALQYIRQISEALIEVHNNGLLHRDIRPGNIMVRSGKAEAVLIDFDLAMDFDYELTATRRGELMEGFAPIELYARSAQRGPFTDVYSLGTTLYVLLTGKIPVSADERKINNTHLVSPQDYNQNISPHINQAILWAMALEAKDRPQSVQEWLDKLERQEEPNNPNPRQPRKINWEAVAAIATCLTVLVMLVTWWVDSRKDTDKEKLQPSPATESFWCEGAPGCGRSPTSSSSLSS